MTFRDFVSEKHTDKYYGKEKNQLSDISSDIERLINSVMRDAKERRIDNKYWSKLADYKKEITSSIDKAFNAIMELELKI